MKKRGRGQITIFLIIGLILIFVVIALMLLGRFALKKTAKQETIDRKESAFDVQPLKNYISECVMVKAREAILLIGRQGGYTYKSQGGTLIDYQANDKGVFYLEYKNGKVNYDILRPRFPVGKFNPLPPLYPWKTFPYDDESRTSISYYANGAFGVNNMPPLNKSFGQHSFQEQLELYITNTLDQCLEDNTFASLGFTVIKGSKTVAVGINDNDLGINLNYDLDVTNDATADRTALKNFYTKVPIRLGEIHSFVNQLILNDINDIRFNITNTTTADNFQIRITKDYYNKDDLIVVTDYNTKFGNAYFEYVFARKNRNPALVYLPERIEMPQFVNTETNEFSIITNDSLFGGTNALQALDPDEDVITKGDFSIHPMTPVTFVFPDIQFTIEVTDSELADSQTITVVRK